MYSPTQLKKLSKDIALLTLEISYKAQTGHVGSCLSIADLLTVLYFTKLNINKHNLTDNTRDRFILSKGHAAAVLYATLYKKGILSKKELYSFGHDEKGLCEHPEIEQKGVEMTTGSLGHGLAFGAGIALGLRNQQIKGNVYTLLSDGECGEGSVWEAALLCSRLKLSNLMAIVDYNKWQCFGKSDEISNLSPLDKKWKEFGWEVQVIDGHDIKQIMGAFKSFPLKKDKPTVLIAHTISGKGIASIENLLLGHYKVFTKEEYKKIKIEYGKI